MNWQESGRSQYSNSTDVCAILSSIEQIPLPHKLRFRSSGYMEKLPPGKSARSGFELQPRPTTIEDIPGDCLENIMDRLALVDHYKGWNCLVKPFSIGASPFNTPWILKKLETSCGRWSCIREEIHIDPDLSSPKAYGMDHIKSSGVVSPDRPAVKGHCCSLLLLDPLLGSEQEISLNFPSKFQPEGSEYVWHSRWFAADKGLLVLNLHEHVKSILGNRHDMFLVLNPVNFSMSVLPPIPAPLCHCKFPCFCEAVPLKLTVDLELEGGAKTNRSSSYKVYILESKNLPKRLRSNSHNFPRNFRVLTYDSLTKSWAKTGVQWTGTSSYTQIFPVRDEIFYVSTDTNLLLYKFQDGILVDKVHAPCELNPKDIHRFCSDNYCGCVAKSTVFEAEGKMFFVQQTGMVGASGPNCISARIWELNDREMIWRAMPVLPFHRFETCLKPQPKGGIIRGSKMFVYDGILLMIYADYRNAFYHVAGFDVFKKTWCKVPETILEVLSSVRLPVHGGNLFNLNRFVFQPNISTRG